MRFVLRPVCRQESGNALRQLQGELAQLERAEAGGAAALRGARDALSSQQARAKLLARARDDDARALADKQAALDQVNTLFLAHNLLNFQRPCFYRNTSIYLKNTGNL